MPQNKCLIQYIYLEFSLHNPIFKIFSIDCQTLPCFQNIRIFILSSLLIIKLCKIFFFFFVLQFACFHVSKWKVINFLFKSLLSCFSIFNYSRIYLQTCRVWVQNCINWAVLCPTIYFIKDWDLIRNAHFESCFLNFMLKNCVLY